MRRGEITENDIVVIKNLRKVQLLPKNARVSCLLLTLMHSPVYAPIQVYPSSLDGLTFRPPKTAVQDISLIIPKGECFGLLGVNG